MGEIKPPEAMAEDVKQGDHVKIYLEHSTFVGYRWNGGENVDKDELLNQAGTDMVFCALDPFGVTRSEKEVVYKKAEDPAITYINQKITPEGRFYGSRPPTLLAGIQLVGADFNDMLLAGSEKITGYEVIERTKHVEDDKW